MNANKFHELIKALCNFDILNPKLNPDQRIWTIIKMDYVLLFFFNQCTLTKQKLSPFVLKLSPASKYFSNLLFFQLVIFPILFCNSPTIFPDFAPVSGCLLIYWSYQSLWNILKQLNNHFISFSLRYHYLNLGKKVMINWK